MNKTLMTLASSTLILASFFNSKIHFAERYHAGTIKADVVRVQDYGSKDNEGMQARNIRTKVNMNQIGHATICNDNGNCGGEIDPYLQISATLH